MTTNTIANVRKKAVWGPKRTSTAVLLLFCLAVSSSVFAAGQHRHQGKASKPGQPNHFAHNYHLDDALTDRAKNGNKNAVSSVIVELKPGKQVPPEFASFVRKNGGDLSLINGVVLDLPNGQLQKLASKGEVFRVHENRPIGMHNYRTAVTVGATSIRQLYGYTGAGISVAVIDSGIATWHDDLTSRSTTLYPYGNQREIGRAHV